MKKQQKKKNKKSKKSASNEEKATDEGAEEEEEKSSKDTSSTVKTTQQDEADNIKKEEKEEENLFPLDEKTTTTSSGNEETVNIEETLSLQSQLDSANTKVSSLEAELKEALARVSELTKSKEDLEKSLEEERAKRPVMEEYEEGPGPQVGGEASANISNLEDDSLKHKIESLTVENEYLSDKVFTLENKVANLINKQRASLEVVRDLPEHLNKEPLSPTIDHSKPQRESPENRSEIEKLMDRWKGWQVDMRGWRSLGIGPTFDI